MSIREKLSINHDFARKKYIKNDVMILTKALKIRYNYNQNLFSWDLEMGQNPIETSKSGAIWLPKKEDRKKKFREVM